MSSRNNFEERLQALNPAQRKAVDTVEGPVMVIAGPGTGKTELLALRVANILHKTDALADNILCLTFTESGAGAMRTRLVELMGKDAYRVNVHTFHSLGSEIINTNPDYFYSGAEFRPSDELSTHQILTKIFSKLPPDSPLGSRFDDTFTQLRQTAASISDFKRSGLTPDEIQRIVREGQSFIDYIEPEVRSFFELKLNKANISLAMPLLEKMRAYESEPVDIAGLNPLSEICTRTFEAAMKDSIASQKTTALTSWRNAWLEKDTNNEFIFKDSKRHRKLLAASQVYGEYLSAMQEAQLYDYDDMILRVVHALEVFPELRFNLQERYQYILVDEFQDTNGAQMRILRSLISTINQDQPNVMVVGDDDQAIYRFQGAELSNILDFQEWLQNPSVITLVENYRSTATILRAARQVILLGTNRLEATLKGVDKTLRANQPDRLDMVQLTEHSSIVGEYSYIVQEVKRRLQKGQGASSIAILARSHREIEALLPYFITEDIPITYEHRENIFEDEPVKLLLMLAKVVDGIARGDIHGANTVLPEVLAHPAWSLSAMQLWSLSLESYQNRQPWLETMLGRDKTSDEHTFAQWLIELAQSSSHTPLEYMLDILLGTHHIGSSFVSPLKEYFFAENALTHNPDSYIEHLQALACLRQAVRKYRPGEALSLGDLVEYVKLSEAAGVKLENHYQAELNTQSVVIMTAHKAKGLEFESVFITGVTDSTWGEKSRGRSNRLSYPQNLPLGPSGDTFDDRLRLFFVAMTRARYELVLSYATKDMVGKETVRAEFLGDWQPDVIAPPADVTKKIKAAEYTWHTRILPSKDTSLIKSLAPLLENYTLSVTHLNNFIDVTRGGPHWFMLRNLLHFPESVSANAALGSSVHKTLQRAGAHLSATGQSRPLEDLLYDFEMNLQSQRLSHADYEHQLKRGSDALSLFLDAQYDSFKPEWLWEFDFRNQGVTLEDARLTGVIDVVSKDPATKTITVSDYKTGKPARSWLGKTDYEKIKLHKYKQQLMFYKLLVEGSREFRGFNVDKGRLLFVEPDIHKDILHLDMEYELQEMTNFKKLISVVWRCIMTGNFIDTSSYEQNYRGILKFEDDLRSID